jgi:hypothetical protein
MINQSDKVVELFVDASDEYDSGPTFADRHAVQVNSKKL